MTELELDLAARTRVPLDVVGVGRGVVDTGGAQKPLTNISQNNRFRVLGENEF
jgi:hypothetical protein